MYAESDETSAVIGNGLIELRARRESEGVVLVLAAMQEKATALPVLERTGANFVGSPLQAELPEQCAPAVEDNGTSVHRPSSGYGVMNTDGEWNDARQAQFADTHLDFYRVTGDEEHLERARAACRAGFTTVFLPAASSVYPTGWCREPRGMAAENHAHGGFDHLCGVSGFDWGAGSALATAAYLRLHGVEVEGIPSA